MRLYIKGDYTKGFPFGHEDLAHKMWFKERTGQEISFSHSGNDETLREDFYIGLYHNKWENDKRWNSLEVIACQSSLDLESIRLEFEDARISDHRERGDHLFVASSNKDILTDDKRALYVVAIEVATAIYGQISEDDKETWLTVDEFKKKRDDVLSLTFEEAHELALKEIFTIKTVREPIWDELEKQKEEYIKIHGERIYPEDEEYYDGEFEDEVETSQ